MTGWGRIGGSWMSVLGGAYTLTTVRELFTLVAVHCVWLDMSDFAMEAAVMSFLTRVAMPCWGRWMASAREKPWMLMLLSEFA